MTITSCFSQLKLNTVLPEVQDSFLLSSHFLFSALLFKKYAKSFFRFSQQYTLSHILLHHGNGSLNCITLIFSFAISLDNIAFRFSASMSSLFLPSSSRYILYLVWSVMWADSLSYDWLYVSTPQYSSFGCYYLELDCWHWILSQRKLNHESK